MDIIYVITLTEFYAGRHGDGTEPVAGYGGVAESWADHIGDSFQYLTLKLLITHIRKMALSQMDYIGI